MRQSATRRREAGALRPGDQRSVSFVPLW